MPVSTVDVPGHVAAALHLASVTIEALVDPDPQRGLLTALRDQGAHDTYDQVVRVRDVVREALGGGPAPQAAAMVEFLEASIAVWREIDGYANGPVPTSTEAPSARRLSEAWDRYRELLDAR